MSGYLHACRPPWPRLVAFGAIACLLVVTDIPTATKGNFVAALYASASTRNVHNIHLSRPPIGIDRQCPNFFVISSEYGGIGHRMTAVALGLAFAMEVNASIILHSELESLPRWDASGGGTYPYFRRLFNLYSFPTSTELSVSLSTNGQVLSFMHPTGQAHAVVTKHCQQAVEQAHVGCHQVMLLPTGHERSCLTQDGRGQDYCIFTGVPGAFQKVRPLLQDLYSHGAYSQLPLVHFQQTVDATVPTAAVAWFIRNDDIQLFGGRRKYWTNLVAAVDAALQGFRQHHYVVSQKPIGLNDSSYGFLHQLPHFPWTPLAGLPVDVAMYHLIAADVVVHCGSSFSMVASLVAQSSQVSLFALPKESKHPGDAAWQTYWLDGSIPISQDGSISEDHVPLLRSAVEYRISHKPDQWLLKL